MFPFDRLHSYVIQHYGRKAGFHPHFLYRLLFHIGGMQGYAQVDWTRVARLVFVCSGNICRSPYAEFKARSLGLTATSFGLSADGRSGAHPVAARIALSRGIDLDVHRCVSVEQWIPQMEDLLIGMEPKQCRTLRRIADQTGAQLTLLGIWSKPLRPYIQDPNGLCDAYFETCFGCIDSAIERIAPRLERTRPETGQ